VSFNVLVIPEDPTHNGYILKPLVIRLLEACGKPNANVTVLPNPRAKGYDHAKVILRNHVFDRYAHFDLLLFLPDADGKNRSKEFEVLEAEAAAKSVNLICCAAEQEVEVWLLAGHIKKNWQEIRADVSVKENTFAPFLAIHGDRSAGDGRKSLMQETLQNFSGLLQRCPELEILRQRITKLLMN
jgi:hypothetical protein